MTKDNAPAEGLWPLVIGILMLFCCILIGFGTFRQMAHGEYPDDWYILPGKGRVIVMILVTMVLAALLFEPLGVPLVAMFFVGYHLKFTGKCSWRLSILLSLAIVAFIILVFNRLMGIPIPLGIFSNLF